MAEMKNQALPLCCRNCLIAPSWDGFLSQKQTTAPCASFFLGVFAVMQILHISFDALPSSDILNLIPFPAVIGFDLLMLLTLKLPFSLFFH
jgi:hypothetical protein